MANEPSAESRSPGYAGVKVKGRYVIEREIGRGGMGSVWLARDEQLFQRRVVIKILLGQTEQAEWFLKKFIEEQAALAMIDHPGVVGVLDSGEMPDRKPFLVMQYVDGTTLRKEIPPGGLPFATAAAWIRQLGSALSAAHARGITHRDLKPENIMLQRVADGETLVKIIDFGIAVVKDAQAPDGARSGIIAGSFPYMAPEQFLGEPEQASDIFSLGVIAWEMLAGVTPKELSNPGGLLALANAGFKLKPRDLRADIPERAEKLILKALSAAPKERPARARDFGIELAEALEPKQERSGVTGVWKQGPEDSSLDSAQVAHVLFLDIVGASTYSIDGQRSAVSRLQTIARATTEFQRARAADQLISLATGDGFALVFLQRLEGAIACATQIAEVLKKETSFKVRMGVHTGPVFLLSDVTDSRSVAGAGISRAETVMSCGDADHILISDTAAEALRHFGRWRDRIHDVGLCQSKEGPIHVWSLHDGSIGNPATPSKFLTVRPEAATGTATTQAVSGGGRWTVNPIVAIAAAALITLGGIAVAHRFARKATLDPSTAPRAETKPAREIVYSLLVKKPDGSGVEDMKSERIFAPNSMIRFLFRSSQQGYLYLVNESPPQDGQVTWVFLYPSAAQGAASGQLGFGSMLAVPPGEDFLKLDEQMGTEKVHVIWADAPLEPLERIKKRVFESIQGAGLMTPEEARVTRELVERTSAGVETVRLETGTAIRGPGNVITKTIRLEHY